MAAGADQQSGRNYIYSLVYTKLALRPFRQFSLRAHHRQVFIYPCRASTSSTCTAVGSTTAAKLLMLSTYECARSVQASGSSTGCKHLLTVWRSAEAGAERP